MIIAEVDVATHFEKKIDNYIDELDINLISDINCEPLSNIPCLPPSMLLCSQFLERIYNRMQNLRKLQKTTVNINFF